MLRRAFLAAIVGSTCAIAGQSAFAQSGWEPTEPVEFVVPYSVGSGADLFARIMTETMVKEEMVPVPVQVVNQPGGGSAVGIGYVLSTRADNPNTLVLVNNPTQVNPMVVPEAPGLKDLQPIYNFMLDDFIMVVRADAKWQTAAELAAEAKTLPPQTITVGAGGPVGGDVMGSQAFARAAGIELNRVTFNGGGEVLTALLGGHVDLAVANPIEYIGQIESGAVRVIGVLREERFPELPGAPTLAEQGLEVQAVQIWRGIALPPGAPEEAVTYWVGIMDQLADSEPIQAYLRENLAAGVKYKGEELLTFLAAQEELYRSMLAQ